MKHFIAIALTLICFNVKVFSQAAPSIQWQKTLGGSSRDIAGSIQQTTDGGYIVAGFTSSNDGDVTGYHGGLADYWIAKLDAYRNIIWQKTFGGTSEEGANSVQQTTDGGYIIAGYTSSNDGDVTGNHGHYDYWIVKLDAYGNRIWQKTLGGTGNEIANSIQQTTDGGYIVAGYTSSNDGDVTGNHGSIEGDYWIVKLDTNGNIIWQKTLGGTGDEIAHSIQQTTDGSYIVAGYTASNDGDVTGNHGNYDCWIVKLDVNGNIIWQKTLGASSNDWANSIGQTGDGGYIVAGYTASNKGDVTGNHGVYDCWIVKLDADGNSIWQKTLGGSSLDEAASIQQTTDGGYIVAGFTDSYDGDIINNHGGADYWIVKLDAIGSMLWQKTLGGTLGEGAASIQQTTDGGYIVAGNTSSNDGDITGNHGNVDYWIVKLTDSCTPVTPAISIAASPGASVCIGSQVTFTATATNGGTTPVYQWKNNGINVGTNSKTYVVDTALKNGDSIYCILTSNSPCAITSTAKSNGIKMVVNNPVTPKVTIAVSSGTTICAGSKVTFTATAENGGNKPIYQWKKNEVNVGTNSNTYVIDTALKNGDSIYCVLASNGSCVTMSIVNSNGIKMIVNSPVTPAISVAASPGTSVCIGSKVTFTATATNGGTAPVYQWKKNGVAVGINSKTYVVDTALKNGDSIYCIFTGDAACATTSATKSNVIKMTVSKPVTPAVTIAALPSTSIYAGGAVTFTSFVTDGGTSLIYQWKKNEINVGTNSKTYIDNALENGDSIYCVLTGNTACATPATVKSNGIKMIVKLKHESKELSLTATPNPFKNSVQLTVVSPASAKAVVLIIAITGQQVFKQDVLLNPGSNVISVATTGWSAGTYYVQVGTGSETKSCKIIKG